MGEHKTRDEENETEGFPSFLKEHNLQLYSWRQSADSLKDS